MFQLNWQRYFITLLLIFSIGFLASGAISWIAANWDFFSRQEKLLIAQIGLAISVGMALFSAYKESVRDNTQETWQSLSFFFLTAVLVGGLFALFGQIYQTGADTWELFAIWSAVQLPLLLLFPNIASALLFMTTSLLATYFYSEINHKSLYEPLIMLNAGFVVIAHFFTKFFKDRHEILLKISSITLAIFFVQHYISLFGSKNTPQVGFILMAVAGGLFCVYHYCLNSILKVIWFITGVIIFNMWLVYLLEFEAIFLLLCIDIAIAIFLFHSFSKMPEYQRHWLMYIGKVVLIFLITMLGIAFVFLSADGFEDPSLTFALFAVLGAIGGASIITSNKRQGINVSGEILLLIAHIFALISCNITDDNTLTIIITLFYSGLTIWSTRCSLWVSVCSLLFTLGQVDYLLIEHPIQQIPFQIILDMVAVFGFWRMSQQEHKPHPYLNAAAWASVLFFVVRSVQHIFFSVHAHLYYENVSLIKHILGTLTLLFVIFTQTKKYQMSKMQMLIALSAGIVAGLGLQMHLYITLALSLLLLAYPLKNRVLFGVAILWFVDSLWNFYYFTSVPWLHKSALLAVMGALFFLCYLWFRSKSPEIRSENQVFGRLTPTLKWKGGGILVGITALLAVFNQKIHAYENIFINGKSVILNLAPTDPRSLMQGDYMILDYALVSDIRRGLDYSQIEYSKRYVLVKKDERGVANFCRLESDIPTSFDGCEPEVYLPVKIFNYWEIKFPTQDFFFPEGQGEHFSQAQYAEYRFKDGKALLYRLLDKDLKAL
ncbi:GDYXXLXY domain-containing protein [Bisgaard Taxon 10/6]|uniref:GDYXXLXY domain-containing protein n=1 Tax=Exercitatus varius TaxID=67857 RepID=A0ABT6EPK8_9PAST|nr:GDYXXLXY domain-containing protein [Exercitatus varius]MDG2940121.1 GDYXXLXY domain-containing protein [Exercitatus varius]MDG2945488.1 GDYXXLXY domain-containing protein [Exercitatus varius]